MMILREEKDKAKLPEQR